VAVPISGDDVGFGFDLGAVRFQQGYFVLNHAVLTRDAEIDAGIGGDFVGLEHDDVDAVAVEEFHRIGDVAGEAEAEDAAIEFPGLFEIGAGETDLIDGAKFEGLIGGHFFSALKGVRREFIAVIGEGSNFFLCGGSPRGSKLPGLWF
jgi:hypothetical protein